MSEYTKSPEEARTYFPRGLLQPEGSFRFSIDALLLAHFAWQQLQHKKIQTNQPYTGYDLGTGCGVVSLALNIYNPQLRLMGMESNPKLHAACLHNATTLGFEHSLHCTHVDVATIPSSSHFSKALFVVSNPPWYQENTGKLPHSTQKQLALHATPQTLDHFVAAAKHLLEYKGSLFMIYNSEYIGLLLQTITSHSFACKRLQFIHGAMHKPAKLVLLEAGYKCKHTTIIEPPLILSQQKKDFLRHF